MRLSKCIRRAKQQRRYCREISDGETQVFRFAAASVQRVRALARPRHTGTEKTLAAKVIGTNLERDVCRSDFSKLVSKYIGETEKNLTRVFAETRDSKAVFLFDEADALVSKRA